jgi:hypothetical protein
MRVLTQSFLRFLELLPGIGRSIRVVNRLHAIRRLEEERRWAEARALRATALKEADATRAAPLWRSEGEDLLHNRKEYAAALEAFRRAEQAVRLSPALSGVSAPDRILAGAAQAALLAGDLEAARAYTAKLTDLVAELARQEKDPAALAWHRDLLEKLARQLPPTL